ncbi:hypothetical protein NIES37_18310 [Tolypothrix tenuis PCC 7101]|uniref:Uncharacterized protein n=1 Tax=Tolypothrix tenuis PCC 7101 TaxID=231146 RepID=A0A1Z4MWR6_9CYAN|nr:hypothetical protein [Aulosira sp. FACHB-113]BAY97883.1 hypothetical protein NIES37_18310 [Tolypothrix tenuis PCC 7101]BAZ71610.1 hypothetical protein NIES50_01530 [Aulosira laxa NIES-50]
MQAGIQRQGFFVEEWVASLTKFGEEKLRARVTRVEQTSGTETDTANASCFKPGNPFGFGSPLGGIAARVAALTVQHTGSTLLYLRHVLPRNV